MKKIIVTIISILVTASYIIKVLLHTHFSDRQILIGFLIIISPYIFSNLLTLYFLVHSLFQKEKDIDDSNMTIIISLIGTNLVVIMGLFINLQKTNPNSSLYIWGIVLSLTIYPFYILGLITLRYNLTILPEANSLNTKGIYSISRHPLYLCYIVWFILQNFVFQTWIIILVSIIQIAALILRGKYEEKVLEKNFPEYNEYKKTVGWIGRKVGKVSK